MSVDLDLEEGRLPRKVLEEKLNRLARAGLSAKDAAEHVSVHPHTARAVYNDPGFRAKVLEKLNVDLAELDDDLKEQTRAWAHALNEQAWASFQNLIEALEDPQVRVRDKIRINMNFMDRNAASVVKRGGERDNPTQVVNIDADAVQLAVNASREMDVNRT